MRRFGGVTFRWVNGFDIVPTLPPEVLGPFQQLPPSATLWRTLGGACTKAAGALLADCPPPAAVAAALGGGDARGDKQRERRGGGRDEGRCRFVVADHRLFKGLGALGACAAAGARARGDACAPRVISAVLRDDLPA